MAYATANQTIRQTLVRNARVEILAPGGSVGSVVYLSLEADASSLFPALLRGGKVKGEGEAQVRALSQ